MATLDVATSLISRLAAVSYGRTGDLVLAVEFSDANGVIIKVKTLRILADGSGVQDERGTLLTPNSPAALVTDLANVQAHVDASLTALIAAGKIGL